MIYSLAARGVYTSALTLPASKSMSNRALLLRALSRQGGNIINLSDSDDTTVLHRALRSLPPTIDIHASGTAMRFLTAFLSAREGEHILTGTARMQQRPIAPLVAALRQLGADISYTGTEGCPPLLIRGRPLRGGTVSIAGDVSSQYISALLMIAPTLTEGLTLHLLPPIVSQPYIDLTLSMMRAYGAQATWTDDTTIAVKPIPYQPTCYVIEGDWSAAAFWYETLALAQEKGRELRLSPLTLPSIQGDAIVADIFANIGVATTALPATTTAPATILLRSTEQTVARMDLCCAAFPDLVPALVTTCCGRGIPFSFTGLQTLRHKESDRRAALQTELRKVGYEVQVVGDDRLVWQGTWCEPTGEPLNPHDDHRLAMALAPLALVSDGIQIAHPAVVSKSYPTFWQHLQQVAVDIREIL